MSEPNEAAQRAARNLDVARTARGRLSRNDMAEIIAAEHSELYAERDELKTEVATLKANLSLAHKSTTELREEVERLRRESAETMKAAFRSGYRTGHHQTVDGGYQWCEEGGEEVAADWYESECLQEQTNDD